MQSKSHSLIESIMNVASGFIVSLLIWIYIVCPVYDVKVTMLDNLTVTLMFTFASIIRSYAWRRLFNHHTIRSMK